MTTSIVVLTLDSDLSTLIGTKKTFFIPKDIRDKYPACSIVSLLVRNNTTPSELASYFLTFDGDGIIVLCDNRLAHLVPELGTPLFTVMFDHTFGGKQPHNYFGMILSKVLKAFKAFENRFEDQKMRRLLILPLRNFSADELRQLHGLFRNGVTVNGQFSEEIDRLLSLMRSRQRPKTDKSFSKKYVVDDDDRYFEYGHEVHARLETTVPPHKPFCAVSGAFRFGKRYDKSRHFNLSREGGQVDGTFQNCHDGNEHRGPCSHLNMFPNDFYGAN